MRAAKTYDFQVTPRVDLTEIWVAELGCEAVSSIKCMKPLGYAD
jgi:hypothetical protein